MLKGYTLNRKPATLCIQVIQFPFMWNGSLAFLRCNGILLLVKKRDYQCARIYLLVGLLERHTIVYPSTDILRQWFQRPRKDNVAVAYACGKPQVIVPLLSLLLQCQRLVDTTHTPERGSSIATLQFEYHTEVELTGGAQLLVIADISIIQLDRFNSFVSKSQCLHCHAVAFSLEALDLHLLRPSIHCLPALNRIA